MRIGSGAPPGDFLGAVDVALGRARQIGERQVALNDAGLSVEGAADQCLAATIEEDAKATLPRGFS